MGCNGCNGEESEASKAARALYFGKGAGRLARSILHIGIASREVRAARRAECAACPHRSGRRCKPCGCSITHKTRLRRMECPDGRWPRV